MLSSLLLGVLMPFSSPPQTQYRDPVKSKFDEIRQFHMPAVKPMPGEVLIDAFNKRMKMIDVSPFKNVPWRSIGPEKQGGRVVDVAVPRKDERSIYVAFATGGLWRTENNGQSWTPLFDNQSAFGIGDIDITDDGKTIWVGTGEGNNQRTSYAGTGVFKSTDRGATWTNMGLHDTNHIGRVVIDPKNSNVVYVAALGPLYSEGGQRGLYKTTDGGKSWNLVLKGDNERTGCMDVAIDPRDPNKVYASMYDRDRRAWNYLESGPGSGAYRSEDGGKTWQRMPLPSGIEMGRTNFGVAPSKPSTVYAFMDNQGYDNQSGDEDEIAPPGELTMSRFMRAPEDTLKDVEKDALTSFLRNRLPNGTQVGDTVDKFKKGDLSLDALEKLMLERNPEVFDKEPNQAQVWRTDDSGKTWHKTRDKMGDHGGYYWNEAVVAPNNPEEVYTLGLLLLKSTNGGGSWSPIARSNHVDHHVLWIDPENPDHMVNGNDGGVYVSYDHGENWTHWNNLAVGQFTTLALDDATPYNVYGGLQDNGTEKGPSNYRPGISDINDWETIGGGDGSNVAVDPRGNIVYTASQFGAHSGRDSEKNQRWSARKNPGRGEEELRYNWVSPLIISPHHPDIIYLGAQKLMRSFNNGRSYEYISGDLTKDIPNGDVPFSTLTTISESPITFGRIYVGADDGSVKTTPDGGVTWQDIATPQPDRWVTRIVASKYAEGRVYCTQNGYRQDEWTPYVWVSEDHGKNWKSISANLPNNPVNTVREDPTDENILYVGTDMGVYVSIDRGMSWIAYGTGIPNTPVHDLQIQPSAKELVAATHARSMWVVSTDWIYKADKDVREKEFHEFDFTVPTGRDNWPYRRTSDFADAEPMERKIQLTLYVKEGAKGSFAILDKDGKTVKSGDEALDNGYNFLSFDLLTSPGDPNAKPDRTPPKTGADVTKDPFAARRPDYLPKGKYKLQVKWGSHTYVKEFEIK